MALGGQFEKSTATILFDLSRYRVFWWVNKLSILGRCLLSKKIKTSVVCLILSIDKSPWKDIQELGQNETFVSSGTKNLVYLRYLGHDTTDLPISARIALAFKGLQRLVFTAISESRVLGFISNLSLLRLGDNTLRKTDLWGLPATQLRRDSQAGNSKSPDTLLTQSLEHYALIGLKTIQAFQYVIDNYEFDFIFRTNTSSYVDGDLLVDLAKELGEGDVLGGVPVETRFGKFASGAGIMLSRTLVLKILEQRHRWRHGLIDDVALSKLVEENVNPKVSLTPLPRLDINSLEKAKLFSDEEIKSSYHIRCKTETPDETIKIMKEIWLRKTIDKSGKD